jgi:hypothetical protein
MLPLIPERSCERCRKGALKALVPYVGCRALFSKDKSNLSRNLCENIALAYDSFGSMVIASAYSTTSF